MTEATPARSEVTFEVDGGTRGLRFDFNAIVEIEAALNGKPFGQVANQLAAGFTSFSELRVLTKVGLNTYAEEKGQKKKNVSLQETGVLIQKIGLKTLTTSLQEAFVSAFPDIQDDGEDSEGEDSEEK